MGEYEAIAFLTDVSYESRLEGIKILHSELKAHNNKSIFSDNFEISRSLSVTMFDREIDVRIQALSFVNDFISGFQGNEDDSIHTLIPALLNCLEDSRSGVQLNSVKILKKSLTKANNFQSALEKIIIDGIYSKSKKRSLSCISKIHFIVEDCKSTRNLSRLTLALFNQLSNKHLQAAVFNAIRNLQKMVDEDLFQKWCQNVPTEGIKTYNRMKKTGRGPSASSIHRSNDVPHEAVTDSTSKILLFGFLPQSLFDRLSSNQSYHVNQHSFEEMKHLINTSPPISKQDLPHFVEFLINTFDVSNAQINSSCSAIMHHTICTYKGHLAGTVKPLMAGLMPYTCSKVSQLKDNIYTLLVAIFANVGAREAFGALRQYLNHSKCKLRQESLNVLIIVLLTTPLEHVVLCDWSRDVCEKLLDHNRLVRQAAMECCALIANELGGGSGVFGGTLSTLEERKGGQGLKEAFESRMAMRALPQYNNQDACVEYVNINKNHRVLEWVLLAGADGEEKNINDISSPNKTSQGGVIFAAASNQSKENRLAKSVALDKLSHPINIRNSFNNRISEGPGEMRDMLTKEPLKLKKESVHKQAPIRVDYNNNLLLNKDYESIDTLKNMNISGNHDNKIATKTRQSYVIKRNSLKNHDDDNYNSNNNNNNNNKKDNLNSTNYSINPSEATTKTTITNSNNTSHIKNSNNINNNAINGIPWDDVPVGRSKNKNMFANEENHEDILENRICRSQKIHADKKPSIPPSGDDEENDIHDINEIISADTSPNHLPHQSSSSNHLFRTSQNFSYPPTNNFLPLDGPYMSPQDLQTMASYQNHEDTAFVDESGKGQGRQIALPFHHPYNRRISVVQLEMADNLALAHDQSTKGAISKTRSNIKDLRYDTRGSKLNINEIIQTLNSDNWKAEVASLEKLSQVCQENPHHILPHLQPITQAVVSEVRNLRSNVSRAAIRCLAEFFRHLKSSMEPVVEKTMMELLCRVGQPSNFMKEEATRCMQEVVANVSPSKSLQVLINHGSMSKNVSIKNVSSRLMLSLCEMLGVHEIFTRSPKEFTAKVLNKTAQYLVDGSPEVRANGRRILNLLRMHPDFDKNLRYHVSSDIIKSNIFPAIRSMQMRGDLDNMTSFSAHQRTSPYHHDGIKQARYHSAGNLYSTDGAVNCNNNSNNTQLAATHPSSKVRKPQRFTRVDEATMENIDKVVTDLAANDYRLRWRGLDLLSDMVLNQNKTTAVAVHINKVFDKLVPCLKDRNFKVKVHALETLHSLLTLLSPHLNTVINMTIAAVTTNLASSNKEVHDAAVLVLDSCAKVLDPGVLLSSMVTSTINANVRYKVEMVDRVSELVSQVPPQRHKIISLLVLPLLWQLLSSCVRNSGTPLHKSTCHLATEIKVVLGDALMDAACINSKVTLPMRESLAAMLNM